MNSDLALVGFGTLIGFFVSLWFIDTVNRAERRSPYCSHIEGGYKPRPASSLPKVSAPPPPPGPAPKESKPWGELPSGGTLFQRPKIRSAVIPPPGIKSGLHSGTAAQASVAPSPALPAGPRIYVKVRVKARRLIKAD